MFSYVKHPIWLSSSDTVKLLPIPLVSQSPCRYWCWAACISSIAKYLKIDRLKTCEVANRALNSTVCCQDKHSCDKPISTDKISDALWGLNIIFRKRYGPLSEAKVKSEIDRDSPVLVYMTKPDRVGHVVLVIGYEMTSSGMLIYVNDPLLPEVCRLPLLTGHENHGKWENSWFQFRSTR